MGKHEIVKPANSTAKSTDRVRKHREAMRAKGYRLKSVWVRDVRDPAFREQMRAESLMLGARQEEEDVQRWIDTVSAEIWDDEPDYKW
jgi:hypothetical protein